VDIKTLEYMENRAKKARAVVEKIDRLVINIEKTEKVKYINFLNDRNGLVFDSSTVSMSEAIKKAYVEVATKRIKELEAELAEL
jgi:NACalpha-BTF3-like transcription factor